MSARTLRARVFVLFLIVSMLLSAGPLPIVPTASANQAVAAASEADTAAGFPAQLLPGVLYHQGLRLAEMLRQELPEEVPSAGLGLQVEAAPFYAHPGDAVTITVVVANAGQLPLEGVVVSATLPAGLAGVQAAVGAYDPATGRWQWPLPLLEAGTGALTATLTARVTGQAMLEGHAIVWAEGSGGTLAVPARDGALVVVGDPAQEVRGNAEFQAAQGGRLQSADGRVAVDFPPGALGAPGLARTGHRPWGLLRQEVPGEGLPEEWTAYYRVLPPFELTAEDDMGGPLRTFAQPVTITVQYDPLEVAALGMEEVDLALFWWDETYVISYSPGVTVTGLWVPLPSRVDLENHTVVAATEHFSDFGLSDGSSPSDAFLPGVQAFQVSLYTGAGTASYPIEVPAAPGGLAPSLSLSYNSGAYDGKGGSREKQQAGWAGRGWSLGLDYIAVVKNPNVVDRNRNSYAIVLNGVSSDLVRDEARVGSPSVYRPQDWWWHPADEQYWKVWMDEVGTGTHSMNGALPDTVWYVQTKDGTVYQFGSTTPGDFYNRAWWGSLGNASDGCGRYVETYKWLLTKVTDKHQNKIGYTYGVTGQNPGSSYQCGVTINGYMTWDAWPTVIQWGTNDYMRFRVVFESSARTGNNDTQFDGTPRQYGTAPHETRVLTGIRVESKQGASWELVRRYDLGYNYSLRPDNGDDYPKLTLERVQMKGADGATALPATTFSYNMSGANYTNGKYRLQTVDNGYGGVVTYGYEQLTMPTSGNSRNRVTTRTVADGLGHSYQWSYSYSNQKESYESNTASIWYAQHVAGDQTWLVHPAWSSFVGHRQVIETDPNGNKVEHWFYQGDGYDETHAACTISTWGDACAQRQEDQEALRGREWKTIRHSSSTSVTYQKMLSDFTVEHLSYTTDVKCGLRRTFSYQSQAVEYTYDGDATERHRTTRYVYDPSYQGNAQWGNLTHVKEYGERDPATQEPVRTTLREYKPNTDAWIVGAMVQEVVYEGEAAVENWQSLVYYIYDNQAPFAAPVVGDMTRVMRAQTLNVGTWLAATVDTSYVYDSYGNRTSETVYNSQGSLQPWFGGSYSPATGDARTTSTAYDGTFHLYPTSVSYPNGRSETAGYDYLMGLVTSYTDVNGDQTQYRYDTFGRFWKLWKPGDSEALPTVENQYYDATMYPAAPMLWQVWYKGEANAAPWTVGGTWERRFYDGMGRLVEVQKPDYDWDGAGGGHEIVAYTLYDGLGQKTSAAVPYQRAPYVYDPNCAGSGKVCNPYLEPDLNQPRTLYAYDPVGRVTQVTNPDGTTVQTAYADWVTKVVDEAGHKVEQEVDGLGRMVWVREYTGVNPSFTLYATTSYGYDVKDQLTGVTDAAGNQTQVQYDKLGQKVDMLDPDMGHWTYGYDYVGNMTWQVDAKGQTINFSYDTMNRVTLKDLPGGTSLDVHYDYDNALGDADAANSWGKLRRAYVGTTTTANGHQYKYDTRGRTIWERVTLDVVNYDTSHTYDPMDRPKTMTYPGGEVVTNGYLPSGALNSVAGTSTYVGQATYTPWGALDLLKLGPAGSPVLQVDYSYYAWNGANGEGQGRLQRILAGTPGDTDSLQDLRYTDYDLVGNVKAIQDWKAGSPQTQSFTYDNLDRLLTAQASGGAYGNYGPESYAYGGTDGKIGNLTSKAGVGYTYTDSAHKHAVTKLNGVQKYWYDANGNQTTRIVGASSYTLAYDAENHLTSVSGAATATFVYGPGGERVKGTVGGVTTYYVGSHYEKAGATVRKYYYAGAQRVAMREGSTLYWLLSDHLGSQAITANGTTGAKVAEVRYKAWGEDRYTWGTTPTTYRYTGQRSESSLGLYYYGARWYDAALSRFVQADTVVPGAGNPQGLNRYSYVYNRPLNLNDPTGHGEPFVVQHDMEDAETDPGTGTAGAGSAVSYFEVAGTINHGIVAPPVWQDGVLQPPITENGPMPNLVPGSDIGSPDNSFSGPDSGLQFRGDPGTPDPARPEGERPHWHIREPDSNDDDTFPPEEGPGGYKWGRGPNQRKTPGNWDSQRGGYYAEALTAVVTGALTVVVAPRVARAVAGTFSRGLSPAYATLNLGGGGTWQSKCR